MMLRHGGRVVVTCLVAGAAVACDESGGGTVTQPPPLAGLRYVNLVSDTGAVDIRVVDIVGDAPATFGATFRTGGSPTGAGLQTSPPYQAVEAGTRRIRVFNSSSDPAVAQQILLDTTFTFEADRNYTFALRGFARTGQMPPLDAAIQVDEPPPAAAGQIAVRAWGLAPTLDPAATTPLDAWIVAPGSAALTGSPTIGGQAYPAASAYVNIPTGSYRVAFTAAGTTQPVLFQANMPSGGSGIAGTTVEGTAITVLVVARSVPGSRAPFHFTGIQGISSLTSSGLTATAVTPAPHNLATGTSVILNGADTAVYNGTFSITVVDATTFTYTIGRATTGPPATGYVFWRPASAGSSFNGLPVSRLTSSGTTATLVTLAAHGLATNDIATITGANEPEYNGSFAVTRLNATTVTYTTNGTPAASPATGTPVWRRGTDDFTRPNIMFLVDRP